MLFAAIDIGSNAARLLLSRVYIINGEKVVKKELFVRVPLRLGFEVFKTGRLSEKKINKLVDTMQSFKHLIKVYEPLTYKAYATAAMREADNGLHAVEMVRLKTGIDITIVDGLQEAETIGATNNIPIKEKFQAMLFVDVGGGSTELTVLKKNKDSMEIYDKRSFKIGTIRILENMVNEAEWQQLKLWVKELNKKFESLYCIGTGGNINKIVKLYGKSEEKTVSFDNLKFAIDYLNRYTVEDRIQQLGLRDDRADVIAPASQIYLSVMKWAKINAMYVPKIGLSDGLIHLQYKEYIEKTNS